MHDASIHRHLIAARVQVHGRPWAHTLTGQTRNSCMRHTCVRPIRTDGLSGSCLRHTCYNYSSWGQRTGAGLHLELIDGILHFRSSIVQPWYSDMLLANRLAYVFSCLGIWHSGIASVTFRHGIQERLGTTDQDLGYHHIKCNS